MSETVQKVREGLDWKFMSVEMNIEHEFITGEREKKNQGYRSAQQVAGA